MSIEARLVHSCRITTGTTTTATGTVDEYGGGTVTVTPVTEDVRCFFHEGVGGYGTNGGTVRLASGELVSSLPAVILPATTSLVEGQVLEGLSPGWLRTYTVRKTRLVDAPAHPHLRADLEAT